MFPFLYFDGVPISARDKPFNVLVVGARSESSLPMMWWKEYLYNSKDLLPNTVMRYVGPGLQLDKIKPNEKERTVIHQLNDHEFSLKVDIPEILSSSSPPSSLGVHQDLNRLHDHPHHKDLLQWANVFVLFNPGYGSGVLEGQWDKSLRMMLETRKPIICTSHGPNDLARDLKTLDRQVMKTIHSKGYEGFHVYLQLINYFIHRLTTEEDNQDLGEPIELILPPHENPFRSFKYTIDENETEDCRIVSANHSMYCFITK